MKIGGDGSCVSFCIWKTWLFYFKANQISSLYAHEFVILLSSIIKNSDWFWARRLRHSVFSHHYISYQTTTLSLPSMIQNTC